MDQILKIKSIGYTKKIPDVSDLVKKTDFNAKITEVESKIPNITGLATNSALQIPSKIRYQMSVIWLKKRLRHKNIRD